MQQQPSSPASQVAVWAAAVLMFGAAFGMFLL
jgi:hypothetical protein